MRVEIHDAYGNPHLITTSNPDTLAAWLVETIATIKPTSQAPARILIWPSFKWSEQYPQGQADWIADTRILGQSGEILRPLDLIDHLRRQIDHHEELAGRDHVSHRRKM